MYRNFYCKQFSFWGAGVGAHSTTKIYFETFPSIFIWWYFILRWWGKAHKNRIQMLCTKSSVWEPHVIGWSFGMMKHGALLYPPAAQTCLLMFFFSLQNKTISILNCVNINIIFTMHSWNIWNITLYKHREKVQAVSLEMELLNRYQLLDHSITDTSCLFFHKITWPLLLLQLNWVQHKNTKNKDVFCRCDEWQKLQIHVETEKGRILFKHDRLWAKS